WRKPLPGCSHHSGGGHVGVARAQGVVAGRSSGARRPGRGCGAGRRPGNRGRSRGRRRGVGPGVRGLGSCCSPREIHTHTHTHTSPISLICYPKYIIIYPITVTLRFTHQLA
ncbi:unnamed protein product, partial [Tetraodon nigroviridis]